MKSKKSVFRIARLLIILLAIIGIVAIAVYPFPNRRLNLEFITEQGNFIKVKQAFEISEEEPIIFNFESNILEVKEVIIYSNFQSMYLDKIDFNEFSRYINNVGQGKMHWLEDRIVFNDDNGISLSMNEEFNTALKGLSTSFLQERLIFAGMILVLFLLLLVVNSLLEEKVTYKGIRYHGFIYEIKKFSTDIKKYGQYMVYAARADLRAEVANSYLNRLWWLLEPFFTMLVYVIVFGKAMGRSVENYSTFIFSALLMWSFFSKTVNYSVKLVRNNKDIVTKVYVPKFILLISDMILNIFKLSFSLIVLVMMMLVFRVQVGLNIFWVIPAYVLMLLLSFGLGMIFLHFGVYVDDLSYAVSILLNMLMFLSGTFYEVMTTLPEPLNLLMMCLNPVAIFIDTMRNALLNNTVTNLPVLGIWLLISTILCGIGVHIVYKNENSYVKVV